MIPVSSTLLALLQSGQYARADLYTFTLANGSVLRWASFDRTVSSGANSWTPVGVRFQRDKWKSSRGLEADSLGVTLSVDPSQEPAINGVPLRQAAERGLFDGATLELDWAYLSGAPPAFVGSFNRFVGTVGGAEADRLGVKLTVNSPLKMLDVQVPWKSYGPGCRWILGDSDCGVNLATFAATGTAGSGATTAQIPNALAGAAGAWNLGTIAFTSGVNAGLSRMVRSSTPGMLQLNAPLPFAPAAGDAFTITPGCDHSLPALTASITVLAGGGSATVAPGAPDYADQGVVYASGPNAGTALILTDAAPNTGQYEVSGDVYTFAAGDAGAQLTVTYVAGPGSGQGTCQRVFDNLARFGGTPFIPPPELAY